MHFNKTLWTGKHFVVCLLLIYYPHQPSFYISMWFNYLNTLDSGTCRPIRENIAIGSGSHPCYRYRNNRITQRRWNELKVGGRILNI